MLNKEHVEYLCRLLIKDIQEDYHKVTGNLVNRPLHELKDKIDRDLDILGNLQRKLETAEEVKKRVEERDIDIDMDRLEVEVQPEEWKADKQKKLERHIDHLFSQSKDIKKKSEKTEDEGGLLDKLLDTYNYVINRRRIYDDYDGRPIIKDVLLVVLEYIRGKDEDVESRDVLSYMEEKNIYYPWKENTCMGHINKAMKYAVEEGWLKKSKEYKHAYKDKHAMKGLKEVDNGDVFDEDNFELSVEERRKLTTDLQTRI